MTTQGDEPAGARAEISAAPAGDQGKEFRAAWKAARSASGKAVVRRRAVRRKGGYRAGMARRPPPTEGDSAA